MVSQLLLVGLLMLVAYLTGWRVGCTAGWRRAKQQRERTDGMAALIEAARFDEPGSPKFN